MGEFVCFPQVSVGYHSCGTGGFCGRAGGWLCWLGSPRGRAAVRLLSLTFDRGQFVETGNAD